MATVGRSTGSGDRGPSGSAEVRVRAPGKVNLSLRVGPVGPDGYHPLTTVFQAVSVYEEVVATPAPDRTLSVSGPQAEQVPTDAANLALRAVELVAARTGIDEGIHLHLHKGVPVAGGMAGGSADAAAAIVACDALWRAGLSREDMLAVAAELGSDVPFSLVGHTAVGTGRGDVLTPALARGEFHWAFAVQDRGLATAAVYRAFDARAATTAGTDADDTARTGATTHAPPVPDDDDLALMQALRAGDSHALGRALRNDLQDAAVALDPALAETLDVARRTGALGAVVSGSGPTVAALGRSRQHALVLAAAFTAAGVADRVLTATGPVAGARLVGGAEGPAS
ncbi:4-(cytidine 5'-diphospho)-2-C-methyl-D-erythritol kinase [Cellulomonas marina]|uniref:4-(cytidine 5'-diphospho)-2-C-methyl-D-erythritol kinase n=1 Tax=Cellulomonas marina TaxID=988821 RepID=UPI000B7D22DE